MGLRVSHTHQYCVKMAERAHRPLCNKKIQLGCYENNGTSLWDFSETLDTEKFRRGTSTVAECHKQAIDVGLLLTINTCRRGSSHVLSTVDR